MKRLIVLAAVLLAACTTADRWMGWTTLVDGDKGLDNFNPIGEANWRAEDGAIVADRGKGGYLVSKQSFRDFQLHVEFWADTTINSGVFLRATRPQDVDGKTAYEVNIYDLRPGAEYATASIVYVGKVPVPPIYKAAGRWNTFDITAKGPRMTVVFNGVQTVDAEDTTNPQGPIALQYGMHGKEPGGVIKFRKVQVKPL